MVKRYTNWCFVSHGHDMMESEHGSFVRFDDFDTAVAALVEIAQGRVYRGVRRGFEPTGAAAIARTMLDALGVEWGK